VWESVKSNHVKELIRNLEHRVFLSCRRRPGLGGIHSLAGVCLSGVGGLFIGAGKSIANVWTDTNLIVDNAGQVANSVTS
jgi:hypothetical protein